ncbi:MAG: HDIG domain-containing protein [Bacteroidia bacterium]|nr:HDIG domain-containing protein [Bacteroidia bacterium]MCC6769131.1 HDIG domain-containing protein [Bacteroidia bacterium]
MNRSLFYLSSQHNILVRLLIYLVSVALIVWMLPHEHKFRYEFNAGSNWLNEDFYAPFSVAIRKAPDEITREADDIIRTSKPVYVFDENIPIQLKAEISFRLDAFLNKANFQIPSEQLDFIRQHAGLWIDSIYKRGIIVEMAGMDLPDLLLETRNDRVREVQPIEYFTKKQALRFIAEKLNARPTFDSPALRQFFEQYLQPNVLFNEQKTEASRKKLIENISPTRGMVSKGELVIENGEKISPEKFRILESIRNEYEARPNNATSDFWLIVGKTIIVFILLGMVLLFLILLRKDLFRDSVKISFLFTLMVAMVFMAAMASRTTTISAYLIPYCALPIIIRAFFDTRLALFAHVITMFIVGLFVPNPFEFVTIQVVGGMSCIFSVVNLRKRSRLFLTIALLQVVYISIFSGFTLMAGEVVLPEHLEQIIWFVASAALTLFAYPIIYLIEKVFGFTSDVSLLELSDTNNPLLKEMALKAPGTFQHSLQVANLAEAAVFKIGGNTLLTRTGALYHDIGKIEVARYYIENQVTGVNPHDELDFDESARIIISHVKRGVQLGRKYKLPDAILDFIRTHHGTSRVQYFYRSFLKSFPDADVEENAFRYPGPNPYSRETAVVMMADAVEATSRSLKSIDSETIDAMVEAIINEQIADNQFINADITFKDITTIKNIFKKMLMNIYHVRMEYPR